MLAWRKKKFWPFADYSLNVNSLVSLLIFFSPNDYIVNSQVVVGFKVFFCVFFVSWFGYIMISE